MIHAPGSTRNKDAKGDCEIHLTNKGDMYFFGMKLYIDVDAEAGWVRGLTETAANVADLTLIASILKSKLAVISSDRLPAALDYKELLMLKDSEPTGWIKPVTQDTGVIIICSGELPCYLVDTLIARINDWDQVSCLYIPYPEQLEQQWLAAEASNPDATRPTHCAASELLGQIPKGCHLLDVEMLHNVHLTWLGSVCGHRLHFFGLDEAEQPQAGMDRQITEILDTTRQLVKGYLQEHFLSPA